MDSRDVGQDVWAAIYRNIKKFEREHEDHSFRGWLRTITNNKITDFLRRNKKQAKQLADYIPTDHAIPDVECQHDFEAPEEQKSIFDKIVNWLEEKGYADHNREAFIAVYAEDKNRDDVAAELGITRNQVDLACSRIKKALRREFGDDFNLSTDA